VVADAPRLLGGRYEVGELIGRGGMAEVHIGHDTRLGRTVAVKILRSDLARDPSFQARFRREAQAAAALNHPAIVAVYDTGEDVVVDPTTGAVAHVPFIVMEYVEGHTVRDILRDGAAVPIEEAVEITAGVLSALEYSHHAGIVHRDIKPANVMLTPAGAVKVMDFGIARAMADAAGTMTQTQAVIGTAQYLSPEQARGEAVDSRSDLYSTGCLLFELLTGRPPFVGDSPVAVAYQHAREVAQPPSAFASDVPEALDRITMKALAKERAQRYGSAAEFRADLEAALRGGHVSAPAIGAAGAAAYGPPTAATQRLEPTPTAAATQVMPQTPPVAPVVPATPATPWEPLGAQTDHASAPVEPEDEDTRRPWVLWTLIGIALVAIVGIVWLLTRGNATEQPSTDVAVPDVVGMTEAEAREAITAADLKFVAVTAPSLEVEPGRVISTDPEADTMVPPGTEVEVTISAGPESVQIPVMTNFTREQALDALKALGFSVENITFEDEHSPDVLKDQVVRTEPAAGTFLAPTEQITVFLASGLVELPDLRGMSEAEALAALQGLKLVAEPTTKEVDDPAQVGKVVEQSRSAGLVEQGATIGIVVGQEKQVEMTQVPANLVNGTCRQALTALGNASLNGDCRYENGDRANNDDVVISTNPGGGQQVPVGTTVIVTVKAPEPQQPPADNNGGGNNNG
jgi:beta-lactam-binding protein with PASTA domain/tRNA A-37 threonylcarbamoyl transferase component Bud32